ncbi:ATPase [Staphylococcus debuckii]|uniref:ATPase n=1 Tax=Staphylococcus debuckii TaxID=2044912 RepID=UPI000F435395|nr:ATPase [Staphylococcus debuckii]AYU54638.1 ATPase [Staphylococcus debuckii]
MAQVITSLILTGFLGYIPYKYLVLIGLVSEDKQTINAPILLLFSVETIIIWCTAFAVVYGNIDISNLYTSEFITLIKLSIVFTLLFILVIFIFNPLIINSIIKLVNITRMKFKLDKMSILDKRDELFNNNRKPVFIVIRDFENKILNEGELITYNSSGSDFDLLEIKPQKFKVSNLPYEDDYYTTHTIIDLKQKVKLELYLMKIS